MTITDPEPHANLALGDVHADSFNLSHAMQVFFGAISVYHVDNTINGRWGLAFCTIEGKIPPSTARMAIVYAKSAIPEHT